jgi:hypothetical protein
MSENEKEILDEAQDDQDEVGEASSDPETSGPSENLRDKAAKTTDKSQESKNQLNSTAYSFFCQTLVF